MFKWKVEKTFNFEDGKMFATITIIESDENCGKKILRDEKGDSVDNVTIISDDRLELDCELAEVVSELKNRIDIIRSNAIHKLSTSTHSY